MKNHPILLGFATGALLLAGCATKPAPNTGFVAGSQLSGNPKHAKFLQRTWVSPKCAHASFQQHFDAIYVASVNTSYLEQQSWWKNQNSREAMHLLQADTEKLAVHMRRQFTQELVNYPGNHYRIATAPGPRTLVVELAIVELVPSKAFWNTGATAAGFVVPGASMLGALGSGSIAMEGRLKDGATGEVIAMFADRRQDQVAPINLRSMTWYGGAERNIDIWAQEGAEFLNLPQGSVVHRKSRLTLKPW